MDAEFAHPLRGILSVHRRVRLELCGVAGLPSRVTANSKDPTAVEGASSINRPSGWS